MDTPVKNHSTSLSSQFEDSPVFNYISNLSPIEPVKSGHNNHTFNSLNFASPPSVFTSPQIGSSSVTRFSLKRHNFSDPLKLDSADSENGQTSEGASLSIQTEKLGYFGFAKEGTNNETPTENLELAVGFPSNLKYDSGSPDCNLALSETIKTEITLETEGAGVSNPEDGSEDGNEQKNEQDRCNWVKLITDDSENVFNFDSPIARNRSEEREIRMVDSGTMSFVSNFLDENLSNLGKEESSHPSSSCEQLGVKESNDPEEGIVNAREADQTPVVLSSALSDKLVVSDSCDLVYDKSNKFINISCKDQPSTQLNRTVRRRSLVFERAETQKRKSLCESTVSSSVTTQPNNKVSVADDKLLQIKNGNGNALSKLPGIGLHLNALASAEVPPDNSSSQQSLDGAMVLWSNETQIIEDPYQTSCLVGEELDQGSPRSKRRKSEPVGESLACKRCNCKRSKCLKLYCECFAAGLYCVEPCSCQDCLNKPIHENIVLETRKQIESRNPLAFAPKVIRSADAASEQGEETNATPASARHKRGCNCRKSGCLKKYCECYQGGVGCSINCRCIACKNSFGQKDGTGEMEFMDLKQSTHENPAINASLEIAKDQDHPITPSEINRPFVPRKPRMPLFLPCIGPPNQMGERENHGKVTPYGFESSQLQMIPEEGTLEAIESNGGQQSSGIKSTSPNSKRVSPPYREFGSLTARRSGRKLILKSIPAFPQLSNHSESSDFL